MRVEIRDPNSLGSSKTAEKKDEHKAYKLEPEEKIRIPITRAALLTLREKVNSGDALQTRQKEVTATYNASGDFDDANNEGNIGSGIRQNNKSRGEASPKGNGNEESQPYLTKKKEKEMTE